jgi:hypothetical protein
VTADGAPAGVVAEGVGAGAGAASSGFWQPASARDARKAIIIKYFMWIPQNRKAVQHLLNGKAHNDVFSMD